MLKFRWTQLLRFYGYLVVFMFVLAMESNTIN